MALFGRYFCLEKLSTFHFSTIIFLPGPINLCDTIMYMM